MPALAAPRAAAQRFARPDHFAPRPILTGSIAPARTLTRTLAGAGRPHVMPANITPANHSSRAFALAGAHGAGAGHILRNQFFANRPAFARATFQGRFAHFPWRHHRHLRPIVIGWFGPLFWPYGYDDLLGYTFYPYAYDSFWPTAYDDVYDGMLGLPDSGIRAAYAATGRPPPSTSGGRAVGSGICSGQTAGVTDWQINEIAQAVEPDEAQRATLDELKAATAQALAILKAACPAELPSTPTGRIDAMHARLVAMLAAVRTVRAPLAKFYSLLNDEQKARFNALGSGDEQNEPQARRDLAQACSERAAGIAALPVERVERAVRPDEAQRVAFGDLRNAIAEAGELLKSNCPTHKAITPVVRLDAMEQRLDAMLRAVDMVQPALAKFYGSLGDEQKERFNRLAPGQG
jgi:LTXXQ motif family protein